MLRLLREARRSLLHRRSYRKYILYALGEVLLVMLGILLALSVNNWNEKRKDREQEEKYLLGLVEDLEEDIAGYEFVLRKSRIDLDALNSILQALGEKERPPVSRILELITQTMDTHSFNHNDITFKELTSAGRVMLIRSDSLRRKILHYYHQTAQNIKFEDLNNSAINANNTRLSQNPNFDINSYFSYASQYPEYEKIAEVSPLDPYPFGESFDNPDLLFFANILATEHFLMQSNRRAYRQGLSSAIELRKDLSVYLSD